MKIYCVSDIHGYYDILRSTLKRHGFKENDSSNILICCGDYWDRGPQPYEVMNYLMSLNNVILVKGTHEYLMENYLNRGFALFHDYQNGTNKTFHDITSKINIKKKTDSVLQVKKLVSEFYSKMVDYYETANFVYVHGWIPCKHKGFNDTFVFDENWRNGDWSESCWYNGIKLASRGILVPGKTVVCGHWHCSYGWVRKNYKEKDIITSEFGEDATWNIYEDVGIYAIDRCTAHTGEMNILILEDELLDNT